ncbi:MAG: GNAT family N-acetyltransferase [Gammaproteobacteria bacterium]|nr:GNAT family N-acetyltransferase [Gammaproteobacteria bacterium]
MIQIKTVNWQSEHTKIREIRRRVFIHEQHVPEALEWDGRDTSATHALAYKSRQAIATGRLLDDGHIGRMAVLENYRHQGIGSQVLQHLVQLATHNGSQQVILSAQVQAIPFYQAHGFSTQGETYLDAGIPHQDMVLALQTGKG